MATSPLRWMWIIPARLLKAVATLLVICALAVVMLIGRSDERDPEE
jgi:hypothetical protein